MFANGHSISVSDFHHQAANDNKVLGKGWNNALIVPRWVFESLVGKNSPPF